MLALHKECLTHRYLLGRLDFLLGLFGFGLGVFHTRKGLRKLRLLRLVVTLQGLELLAELLELLLYLAHPSILLFALNALHGRLVVGLGQRFLQGRHFGRGPYCKIMTFF